MAADDVQALINQGKHKEAFAALDRMKDGERKYFLKGIISLRQKNYEAAHEFFFKAIEFCGRAEYFRMMGIAHLEVFEMEEALGDFSKAISLDEKDAAAHFFMAITYLFMDNPRAEEHMKLARGIDEKKTKQLLRNFYTLFIKNDPSASDAQKKKMEDAIHRLGSRQQ